jgi:transcriptional regulator with XRE-family HTH domain
VQNSENQPSPAIPAAASPPPLPDFAHIERDRAALKVSQAKLCRAAGINEATYSRLRKASDPNPHANTLRALAGALLRLKAERDAVLQRPYAASAGAGQ